MIVRPRTHRFNGWFLRLFARAVVRDDGVEDAARWGHQVAIEVGAGEDRLAVGARYQGTRTLIGAKDTRVAGSPAECIFVDARSGFLNHQPFAVTVRREF